MTTKLSPDTIEYYWALPYTAILRDESDSEGHPIVIAENPELPGCMSHGFTVQEALDNLSDARREYIALLLAQGESVPKPRASLSLGTKSAGFSSADFDSWSPEKTLSAFG